MLNVAVALCFMFCFVLIWFDSFYVGQTHMVMEQICLIWELPDFVKEWMVDTVWKLAVVLYPELSLLSRKPVFINNSDIPAKLVEIELLLKLQFCLT